MSIIREQEVTFRVTMETSSLPHELQSNVSPSYHLLKTGNV